MARIRSIKPEFWRSPSTAKASPHARLLYIAMWGWADDYGAAEWTYRELLGYAFPHDEQIGNAELQSLLTEVAACFGTVFYRVDGRRYYYIPQWDKHQKNERRAQGKFPLPDAPDASVDAEFGPATEMCGTSVQANGSTAPGTGEQGTGEQGKKEQGNAASRRAPEVPLPDLWEPSDAALLYADQNGVDVEHEVEQFRSHAKANDRRQRDWDAAFRTWLGNAKKWARPVRQTPTERAMTTLSLATDIEMAGLES